MPSIQCSVCRAHVSQTFDACPKCGTPLPAAPQSSSPQKHNKHPIYGPGTQMLVGGVFIVVAAFVLSLVFSKRPPAESGPSITAPHNPVDIVRNSAWDGSVYQVERFLKGVLKDPSSFEAIEWGGVVKGENGNYLVRLKYRARNSFGGYAVEEKLFALNPQGEVIQVADSIQ